MKTRAVATRKPKREVRITPNMTDAQIQRILDSGASVVIGEPVHADPRRGAGKRRIVGKKRGARGK